MAIGSIHPKDKEAPLCKCGCGQKVRWSRVNKKYNEYANGHNSNTVPKNAKHLFPKAQIWVEEAAPISEDIWEKIKV